MQVGISIVIPTYLQRGAGPAYLRQLLETIRRQQYAGRYEVCVSDNDTTGEIANVCDAFRMLPIRYKHSTITGASENINAAIDMATSDKVKIMCMDDMFNTPDALQRFSDALNTHGWAVSGSVIINDAGQKRRVTGPFFDPSHTDKNHTGMPSVVAFRKTDARFDATLKTFCDLDFYMQLYNQYGMPALIRRHIVCQRYHNNSQSRNQPATHEADALVLKKRYAAH